MKTVIIISKGDGWGIGIHFYPSEWAINFHFLCWYLLIEKG